MSWCCRRVVLETVSCDLLFVLLKIFLPCINNQVLFTIPLSDCKAFMQKFKEVADSEEEREESKEASDTAGLLEKLTVEEKDTEEKKEEKPVEKVASAEEAEKAVEEKKTEESVPSA